MLDELLPGRLLRCGCVLALAAAASLPIGCATKDAAGSIDVAVYRRAEVDRSSLLEAEVERLRADLRRAEEALVLAESGLRGSHSRADAVSSLAEARIRVERAGTLAPWRRGSIAEAKAKLEDADKQIEEGNFGAALFFVYRSTRIAELLETEARMVRRRPGTRYVRVERVNLRSGPSTTDDVVETLGEGTPVFPERRSGDWTLVRVGSGQVGWVHASLLRAQ